MVKQYTRIDYEQIRQWCFDRNMDPIPESLLPTTGAIVDDVACGFIYFTDSPIAIIEGYYANPKSDPDKRDAALNEITDYLLEIAKGVGCELVKCNTKNVAIIERAKKFGFRAVGEFTALFKEI